MIVLLVACLGVALRLFAVPVTQARMDRFIAANELDLTPAGHSRLHAYLAARRRGRVGGVVTAAAIGLFVSLPDGRVDLRLLLAGWFAGAVLAEAAQRGGSRRLAVPTPVPAWWNALPVIVAGLAVLWTAAAMVLRSAGTRPEIVLGFGIGGLATALAVWAAGRYVRAQIRLARLNRVPAAQLELGLKPDQELLRIPDSYEQTMELVGRVDVARPAPAGTSYHLFGYDREANASVQLSGAGGNGWSGTWSRVLRARYEWLSRVGAPDSRGLGSGFTAASADPETGVLWFRAGTGDADDLQLVLMLVRRKDSYIYWAAPITATARSS